MVDRLGWTLLHFVWEGAADAMLLGVALWATRKASAILRYGLACLGLALLAVLPAITYLLLAPPETSSIRLAASGTTTVVSTVVLNGSPDRDFFAVIVGVWAVSAVVMSVRLLGTLVQIERWKRRHARPAGEEWQARVDVLARRLGIARAVTVLVSDRIGVPAAWGVVRAIVVLPASLVTGLSPEGVETILLHELAHIRRHDYLVNLLQTVVETALFYHPAVWWVSSIVRREREHCCDDVVVATIADPMPYARALLHLEERRSTLPRPTLSAKGTPLMNRIARILGNPPAPARLSPVASTLAAFAVLGIVLGGAYEAQAQSAPKAIAPAMQDTTLTTPATATPTLSVTTPARTTPASKAKVSARKRTLDQYRAAQKAEATAHEAALRAEIARLQAQLAASQKGGRAVGITPTQEKARARVKSMMIEVQTTQTRPAKNSIPVATARPEPSVSTTESWTKAAPDHIAVVTGNSNPFGPHRATDDEIEHSVGANTDGAHYWVEVRDGAFAAVMGRLALASNIDVVIAPGAYMDVTLYVSKKTPEALVDVLCRAANATCKFEGGIYYFSPKAVPVATSGGGGLGGGIRGD